MKLASVGGHRVTAAKRIAGDIDIHTLHRHEQALKVQKTDSWTENKLL
jgi:hypothetical protein